MTGVSLICTLVEQALTRGLVVERQDAWEASKGDEATANSLTAPLLGGASRAQRAAGTAAGGEGEVDAEAGSATVKEATSDAASRAASGKVRRRRRRGGKRSGKLIQSYRDTNSY